MTLISAHVIVDWRNLHGQLDANGFINATLNPTGLEAVLRGFGFEPVMVTVGVGVDYTAHPNNALGRMHRENLTIATTAKTAGWHVLEGHLRHRLDGVQGAEEKQVDVLCALTIADVAHTRPIDAQAVIIVSRDIDLTPAGRRTTSSGERRDW